MEVVGQGGEFCKLVVDDSWVDPHYWAGVFVGVAGADLTHCSDCSPYPGVFSVGAVGAALGKGVGLGSRVPWQTGRQFQARAAIGPPVVFAGEFVGVNETLVNLTALHLNRRSYAEPRLVFGAKHGLKRRFRCKTRDRSSAMVGKVNYWPVCHQLRKPIVLVIQQIYWILSQIQYAHDVGNLTGRKFQSFSSFWKTF